MIIGYAWKVARTNPDPGSVVHAGTVAQFLDAETHQCYHAIGFGQPDRQYQPVRRTGRPGAGVRPAQPGRHGATGSKSVGPRWAKLVPASKASSTITLDLPKSADASRTPPAAAQAPQNPKPEG